MKVMYSIDINTKSEFLATKHLLIGPFLTLMSIDMSISAPLDYTNHFSKSSSKVHSYH